MSTHILATGVAPDGHVFDVILPSMLVLPLPLCLTPLEVLEGVQQITPDCLPDGQSEGAVLFEEWLESGGVLLKWPDGVCVASHTSHIPPDVGLLMYFYGRVALEAHVASLEMGA